MSTMTDAPLHPREERFDSSAGHHPTHTGEVSTRGDTMKRPDMRDYFRARIDYHVNGVMARSARLPQGVLSVDGDVTHQHIGVLMQDGTTWAWQGGEYAARKVNLCYAPLMPKPTTAPQV